MTDRMPTFRRTSHIIGRAAAFLALAALLILPGHPVAAAQDAKAPAKPSPAAAVKTPSMFEALSGLRFREIGPANMGGRVDDFAVLESDPNVVYAGFASGGLWKTTNAGTTWEPVFDNEAVSTIGCVTIAPSDPSIVWVGTGEVNNRQSSSWGNGVYKSADAGRTWKHMGLAETHNVGSIVVHPSDPNVVYVAALGRLWGPNKERGVYKSVDGGATWKQILFVNEDTGVVNLVADPKSPDTLYAAAYQRRRAVFGFNGSGPGSGIHKTTDGGATWTKLSLGLPWENEAASETGRIGLAVHRGNPSIVYALIEHKNGGIFRSEDKGETWTKMSATNPRPMYYSKVRIDPNNDLRIWVLGASMFTSEDGGRSFVTTRVRRIHGDYHAMWIDPKDSRRMIVGSDGGIHWSHDAGRTWDFVNTIAVGQFYEVGFDFRRPYRIYGGLQDNGTWGGPSRSLDRVGIINADWLSVGGGDGFYAQVDPTDPDTVYLESQDGYLLRLDLQTTERKLIPPPEPEGEHFRFQWCTPLLISAHDPKRLYYAAQYVFRSDDRGDNWTKISPDLTTGADRNSLPIMGKVPDGRTMSRHDGVQEWPSITELAESPLNPAVLWAGTDDGCLQMTRDGGKTWKNVADRVRGVPKGTYVTRIVASRHAEGTAYATFDGHRMNDFGIYVYVTADHGETWREITAGLPRNNGVVNVIREHFRNPNLLFLGTEYGAYVSFDRGANWSPLKLNLPTVPVDDIAIHPRENDLILATHGRSIWVLDDLAPFEQMSDAVMARDVHIFESRPATSWRISGFRGSTGHKLFAGPNPPAGAAVDVYLKSAPKTNDKIALAIADGSGRTIRTIEMKAEDLRAGVNRIAWDLRPDPPVKAAPSQPGETRAEGAGLLFAPLVEPGAYRAVFSVGDKTATCAVTVDEDPRVEIEAAARAERRSALDRLTEIGGRAYKALQVAGGLNSALNRTLESWKKYGVSKIPADVRTAAEALQKRAAEIHGRFVAPPLPEGWAGPPLEVRPPTIPDRFGNVAGTISGHTGPVSAAQTTEIAAIAKIVEDVGRAADKLVAEDLAALNKKMNEAGIPHIKI